MFASIVGIFKSTLAPMSDDEHTSEKGTYEKEFVLLNLVDTNAAGLYVTEIASKMVLGRTDAGETEGEDDELEVRFGISNRNVETNQRRKVQMSAQTQGLWFFPAHDLEQVDDAFCNSFVGDHGIGNMCKVKLHQADAKLLDARRLKTLAASEVEPRKYPSFWRFQQGQVRNKQGSHLRNCCGYICCSGHSERARRGTPSNS